MFCRGPRWKGETRIGINVPIYYGSQRKDQQYNWIWNLLKIKLRNKLEYFGMSNGYGLNMNIEIWICVNMNWDILE